MKWLSYILLLALIYIICSAKGCTDDQNIRELNEEKLIIALRDSVRSVFETDSIGDTFIRAYEQTACRKLIDFADYLKIVSDTSLDKEFRKQAAEMVSKIFISGEAKIVNWSIIDSKSEINTLEQLLDRSLSEGMISWIEPFKINVRKPLTLLNDSALAGSLSFYQRRIPFIDEISSDTIDKMFFIDIYALKKVKSFDKEQLRIWEVFLGDIEK
jgi:hypothetical protein